MRGDGQVRLMLIQHRPGKLLTPFVIVLLVLHITGYVLPVLSSGSGADWFVRLFGLRIGVGLGNLCLWQFVTHSMVYPTMCHGWALVWTCLFFIFLGSRLEREWGSVRFAVFYAVTAAAAGFVRAIPYVGTDIMVTGSTGVICAMLASFGVMFRGEKVWLLFTTIRVPSFVIGVLVIILLLNIQPVENILWVSGAAFGLLYTLGFFRWEAHRRKPAPVESDRFSEIDLGG